MREYDAESNQSFTPPAAAVAAAKKGLAQRKKWGRGGLSPAEAKSQGIDSGVTRARKISSGKVSRHDVRRMSAFNRHRKNNNPSKKMPDGGPTAGTIAWNLWGGSAGVNWAKKKSAAMNAETFEAEYFETYIDTNGLFPKLMKKGDYGVLESIWDNDWRDDYNEGNLFEIACVWNDDYSKATIQSSLKPLPKDNLCATLYFQDFGSGLHTWGTFNEAFHNIPGLKEMWADLMGKDVKDYDYDDYDWNTDRKLHQYEFDLVNDFEEKYEEFSRAFYKMDASFKDAMAKVGFKSAYMGYPFMQSIHYFNWQFDIFEPVKCTDHEWSNAYVRDTEYDDDGTAYTTFGQDCIKCNAQRRGTIGGDVSWDKNAETFAAESDSYEWEWDRTDYAPTELIKKRLKNAGFSMTSGDYSYKDQIVEFYEPQLVAPNGVVLGVCLSQNEEFDGFSRLTFFEDDHSGDMGKVPDINWNILHENGLLKGEDSVEQPQGDYYQVYWCGLYDEWKNGHNCADNAKFDIYEDNFIVMECVECGRTATFEQKTPYEGPRNAETFVLGAETGFCPACGETDLMVQYYEDSGDFGCLECGHQWFEKTRMDAQEEEEEEEEIKTYEVSVPVLHYYGIGPVEAYDEDEAADEVRNNWNYWRRTIEDNGDWGGPIWRYRGIDISEPEAYEIFDSETFGDIDSDGQLAQALRAAREKSRRYAPQPLRITKLPHPDQKSLKDFEAQSSGLNKKDLTLLGVGAVIGVVSGVLGEVLAEFVLDRYRRRPELISDGSEENA